MLSNDGDRASILLSEKDKAVLTALLDENFNIPPLEAVELSKKTAMVRLALLDKTIDCELALELMIPKESIANAMKRTETEV